MNCHFATISLSVTFGTSKKRVKLQDHSLGYPRICRSSAGVGQLVSKNIKPSGLSMVCGAGPANEV